MKYDFIFSPMFMKQLDDTFKYICATLSSPKAAEKLMSEIDKKLVFAAENPYMYPLCAEPLSEKGYRKIAVKNYIAVYSVDEDNKTVYFLDLFYGSSNYIDFLTNNVPDRES